MSARERLDAITARVAHLVPPNPETLAHGTEMAQLARSEFADGATPYNTERLAFWEGYLAELHARTDTPSLIAALDLVWALTSHAHEDYCEEGGVSCVGCQAQVIRNGITDALAGGGS